MVRILNKIFGLKKLKGQAANYHLDHGGEIYEDDEKVVIDGMALSLPFEDFADNVFESALKSYAQKFLDLLIFEIGADPHQSRQLIEALFHIRVFPDVPEDQPFNPVHLDAPITKKSMQSSVKNFITKILEPHHIVNNPETVSEYRKKIYKEHCWLAAETIQHSQNIQTIHIAEATINGMHHKANQMETLFTATFGDKNYPYVREWFSTLSGEVAHI